MAIVNPNYHNILHDDMRNGDGLRVVLFLSGCDHHCYNCQNPQTWDISSGIKLDRDAFKELENELEHDYIDGITFTGGDPMHHANLDFVKLFCQNMKLNLPNKTVWIYTGYTWDELVNPNLHDADSKKRRQILEMCDVLVDGKYIEDLSDVNYPWAGSTNQNVIDVQKSLELNAIVLYNTK